MAAVTVYSDFAATAAKSLQSCLTLCDPIGGSPPGSTIPGILQARTLEWVAISFSNAWKWKVKVKLFSRVRLLATPWTAAYQAPPPMGFSRQEYWSGVPSPSPTVILDPKKIKSVIVSTFSPSICHKVMEPYAMTLVIWMLSFKTDFPLSFHLHQEAEGLEGYNLNIWGCCYLLAIVISACASSSPAFRMMYSAYKLNKQNDNIQPWHTPFPIWNHSVVPCPILTVASWPAYRFLRRLVRWSGFPISLRIFHGLSWSTQSKVKNSQWSRSRCFSGILLLFLWSNGCWQFDLWFLCLF